MNIAVEVRSVGSVEADINVARVGRLYSTRCKCKVKDELVALSAVVSSGVAL
jgi:hypothetical protein